MKFAICNEIFEQWPLEKTCQSVKSCGYDGIELAPFTLAADPSQMVEADASRVAETVHAAGLEVTGFHWLLLKPDGMHFTTPVDAVRRRTVAFLQHLVRLCAAMGGRMMVFGSPSQRDVIEGDTYRGAFDRAVTGLREVCEVAGPLGVTIALEPLGQQETTFMQTASDAVEVLEAVDLASCQLHLDVKAMCQMGAPVPQIITDHAQHLAYFHANDANRRGPGFGETDFVPIVRALKQANYDDYVSVEVFDYSPDPQTIASKSIEYLKRVFAKVGS